MTMFRYSFLTLRWRLCCVCACTAIFMVKIMYVDCARNWSDDGVNQVTSIKDTMNYASQLHRVLKVFYVVEEVSEPGVCVLLRFDSRLDCSHLTPSSANASNRA